MNLSKNIKPISYLKANAVQVALEFKASGAEHERVQETLALLKMLAQSQQAVGLGKTVSRADAFCQLRTWRGLA